MEGPVKNSSSESTSSIRKEFERPLSGLFAINKPSGSVSMTLLESLKELFLSSKLFVDNPESHPPKSTEEKGQTKKSKNNKYWQKKRQSKMIKIGQGGTLDPLASGVLIIGLNSATKKLSNFLNCRKKYQAVGLLGCKTDSYDSDGKVVSLIDWKHVKPEQIEKQCDLLQGEQWQIPPIYSALKMDGKPLYEYARKNIPLPRPIEARRCEIYEIKMIDWKEGGQHDYRWPTQMISLEELEVFKQADNLVKKAGIVKPKPSNPEVDPKDVDPLTKRKSYQEDEILEPKRQKLDAEPSTTIDLPAATDKIDQTDGNAVTLEDNGKSPAFTLEMTVSSGTYVRTIVHDIGSAVSSAATVVSLTRISQGDFSLDPKSSKSDSVGDHSKGLACIEWDVFQKAIESQKNGVDEPCNEKGLREWEQELLNHIQL